MPAYDPSARQRASTPGNDLATHDVATVAAGGSDHHSVCVGLQYDDGHYVVTVGRASSPEPIDVEPRQALVLAETVRQAALRALDG